jgi:ABC-type nitrate/sulfonate/bicarbonate transport system substrate-binding protein
LVLSGKADGVASGVVTASSYITSGQLRILSDGIVPYPDMMVLWASDSAIKNKPDAVRGFAKAVSDAVALLTNETYCIQQDIKYMKVSQSSAALRGGYLVWNPSLTVSPALLQDYVNVYFQYGVIKSRPTIQQLWDPQFLPK